MRLLTATFAAVGPLHPVVHQRPAAASLDPALYGSLAVRHFPDLRMCIVIFHSFITENFNYLVHVLGRRRLRPRRRIHRYPVQVGFLHLRRARPALHRVRFCSAHLIPQTLITVLPQLAAARTRPHLDVLRRPSSALVLHQRCRLPLRGLAHLPHRLGLL